MDFVLFDRVDLAFIVGRTSKPSRVFTPNGTRVRSSSFALSRRGKRFSRVHKPLRFLRFSCIRHQVSSRDGQTQWTTRVTLTLVIEVRTLWRRQSWSVASPSIVAAISPVEAPMATTLTCCHNYTKPGQTLVQFFHFLFVYQYWSSLSCRGVYFTSRL